MLCCWVFNHQDTFGTGSSESWAVFGCKRALTHMIAHTFPSSMRMCAESHLHLHAGWILYDLHRIPTAIVLMVVESQVFVSTCLQIGTTNLVTLEPRHCIAMTGPGCNAAPQDGGTATGITGDPTEVAAMLVPSSRNQGR